MKRHQEVWENLASEDPDWSVLTLPGRRHQGWIADLDAFYASGEAEVKAVLDLLDEPVGGRALDFGCGTGRLSFALSQRFNVVTCVDLSRAMLLRLRERAQQFGITGITPVQLDDLCPQSDHDLVLSLLVIQHLPDRASAARAVSLLTRCLRLGGYLIVEVPEMGRGLKQWVQPRWRLYRLARLLRVAPSRLHDLGLSGMSMLTFPEPYMRAVFAAVGLEVLKRELRPDRDYLYVRWVTRRLC